MGAGPTYRVAALLFPRLVGAVYLMAFASLGTQVAGLVGAHGILPAAEYLRWVHDQAGTAGYYLVPTLAWLNDGDASLKLLCSAGVGLALVVMAGVAEAPGLAALWLLYLSLVSVGQDFLSFQWDVLLLEVGFLAIFAAPASAGVRQAPGFEPSPAIVWLLRLVLFRLMFGSGTVKLLSGDPTWRDLSALTYHYETQPLPTPAAWYIHQLPAAFHALSCAVMFAVELGASLLIFAGVRGRRGAVVAFIGLMLIIALTGNYTFFNVLAVVLCVWLIDDSAWPSTLRAFATTAECAPRAWPGWIVRPVAVVIVLLTIPAMVRLLPRPLAAVAAPPLAPLFAVERALAPLNLVNHYGLFAVMTTERPEITVEGSLDGVTWRPYGFKYKPGDPRRPPTFVAPHQPRLDWQMWFAALSGYDGSPWFARFEQRLIEGSPDVLALLAENPFPDRPPRFVRARVAGYQFSDRATGWRTGAWWVVGEGRDFGPAIAREAAEVVGHSSRGITHPRPSSAW